MLAVSSGFLKAIRNKAPQDVRLQFVGRTIGNSDIAITAGGLTYTEILNGETDVIFGRAVMSELSVTLINTDGRFTDFDFSREFTAKIGVKTGNSFEYVVLGVFKGERPDKVRGKLIDFVAHDRMTLFDRPAESFADGLTFPCTLGQIYTKLCDFCGVGYISAVFPNSEKTFDSNPLGGTDYTCREILGYIAEAAGAYARMSRDGAVELVWFANANYTVTQTDRFEMTESEFITPPIDRLEVYNSYGDQLNASGTGDIVYGISDNPFLYIENDTQLTGLQPYVDVIYSRITSLPAYHPSSFRAEFHPAVQCGDIISVVDDYGETISFPVFVQTITWNGFGKATYENTGRVIRQNAPFTQRELEQLKKKSLKTKDLWTYIDSYLSTDEGIASINAAVGGKFVTQDDLTGFVTDTELGYAVDAYINGEEGQAMLTQSLSGKFVTVQEYGNNITLTATAQMFTKAAGNTDYTPSSITLTAQTDGTLTYTWYKNGTAISGQTGNTLSVTAGSITGSAATYKVVGKDTSGKTYSDQITIAKLSDGVDGADGKDGSNGKDGENGKDGVDGANGKDGENGKDGKDGSDGYTTILSNEYIEIPVDFQRFPKTSGTYSCVVSVYRGTTKLSATKNSTLSDGEFKVSTPSGKNGITVSQVVAGTITMSVSTASALSDITALEFNIDIYGGISLPAKIVVTANMNDVAAGAYTVTSNIGSYIDTYITENKGSITNALKGEFVTSDELGNYVKTTEVESKIEQEVSDGFARLTLTAKESTVVENVPTDTLVGDYAEYIYTVSKAYSFKLQNGWYISQNAGDANSFSYGRIEFNFSVPTMVALEIVNYGETYYDYGMVGEIDANLSESATEDTSGIMHSFRNVNAWDGVHTFLYEIPAGVHHIDVKYIKDDSQDAAGDYFKIRAVAVETISTSSGSTIELSSNGTVISSADIVFRGFVTFESLSTPGATTIDGGNIDTDNLHVENIYLGGDNSRKIMTSELGSSGGVVDIGFIQNYGSSSYGKVVKIYADYLYIVPPGGSETDDEVLIISPKAMYFGANSRGWNFDI